MLYTAYGSHPTVPNMVVSTTKQLRKLSEQSEVLISTHQVVDEYLVPHAISGVGSLSRTEGGLVVVLASPLPYQHWRHRMLQKGGGRGL